MNVLVIGSSGTVGSIIPELLESATAHDYTYLDSHDAPYDTEVVDARNYGEIRPYFDDADAVCNLAIVPQASEGGDWDVHLDNLRIAWNVCRAARDGAVDTLIYASTNHVVGQYETDHAPDLYESDYDVHIDHTAPPRPDSVYAVGKLYGEGLARYTAETNEYPRSVAAIRIGTVREPPYDNPYGYPEQCVEAGKFPRGGDDYQTLLRRSKALWQSRRDLANMFEYCLERSPAGFNVFYGVSENRGRWLDIGHAKNVLGYEPLDDGADWTEPPEELQTPD